jgi:hypothetical protein
MREAISAVRGTDYTVASAFVGLYATCGTARDYTYSRQFVDPSRRKAFACTIEWGLEPHPDWPEMEPIIDDVTAGLIESCTAAAARVWRVSWSGTSRWEAINQSRVGLDDLAFGDFTGNGKTDVFRADGTNWFISEDGTRSWRPINTSRVRLPDLALGDFDGDRKTDVFSTGRLF